MRTQIILARKHGQTEFLLIADPSVSIPEQAEIKSELLCAGGVHKEFAEVQIWSSDSGLDRPMKFHSPADKKADEERIARENKAQADALAEAAKAKEPKKAGKAGAKKEADQKPEAPADKKADEAQTEATPAPATQAAQEPVTDL